MTPAEWWAAVVREHIRTGEDLAVMEKRYGPPPGPPDLKRKLWVGLWLVVAVAGGVLVGRFLAPAVVETRDVERLVYRDLAVEDITKGYTFARTVERTVWRNVTTTVTDAGTTTVDLTTEHEGEAESGTVTEQLHRVEIVEVERERVVEKTVTLRPDWRVGALVGASWNAPLVPIAGPLVLGVQVDRRIVGGLSAGLWVNTVGAAGASVNLEF